MTISFSGAASGIDTQSIISALVDVEGMQQTLLENRQKNVQKTVDSYKTLLTKLESLSEAAETIADVGNWTGTTASSTSDHVAVTASGTTGASLTFNVTQLAAAHTLISASSVTSTSDVVASGGTITVTNAEGDTELDVGTGTLSEVLNAINNSDTGLVASAVQVSAGTYRLQVSSQTTGADSEFSLTGLDGFTGMNVLSAGADAMIHVGDETTGYDATSTSNTFASLVTGLSFTVGAVEDNVTVSSTVDGTEVADDINDMVIAANAVLTYIDSATAWDSTTKTASPLNGEGSVRQLQQKILSLISLSDFDGVSLTSSGRLEFNQSDFLEAYKADPAGVARQFGPSATFSADASASASSVALSSSTSSVASGSYEITVTQAATREKWSVDASGGTIAGQTVEITRGDTTVSYTAGVGEDLTTSVDALNERLSASGLGVVAAQDGNTITFTASSYGSSRAFTATLDSVQGSQLEVGQDVAGSINGQAANGTGNVLSLSTGTGNAVGLSVTVDTTAADIAATGGNLGTITFDSGLARELQHLVTTATDSATGTLTSAQNSANAQMTTLQEQIDSWTDRLESYRARLVSQFTAMEIAINTLNTSLTALGGLFATTDS
jgi:flagellar hook-associated protein 2